VSGRKLISRALAGGAVIAVATLVSLGPATVASASSSPVPFTDPAQNGSITLCNKAGQAVTSGSMLSLPFIWKAISSTSSPVHYRHHGLATLYAFQPIEYVAPGDWTGDQLTGSSYFSNFAHPAAAGTAADEPLITFSQGYPLHWQGLLQLRLYYTHANQEPYATTYPTAVLRVTGNTWTMLQGGGTPCSASKAVSLETLALRKNQISPKGSTTTAVLGNPTPTSRPASEPSPTKSSAGASPGGSSSGTNQKSADDATTAADSSGLSTGAKAAIGLGVLALIVLGLGGFAYRRRAPN
jgi:hypothetical protein